MIRVRDGFGLELELPGGDCWDIKSPFLIGHHGRKQVEVAVAIELLDLLGRQLSGRGDCRRYELQLALKGVEFYVDRAARWCSSVLPV